MKVFGCCVNYIIYLQFGFQIYKSSCPEIFFGIDGFENFVMLEFLFNKVAGLQTSNLIKNRFQHRCFSVKFTKSLRTSFFTEHFRWLLLKISYELSLYCIWEWWIVLLCVCIGSPALISFYCVFFVSFFYFFLFFNFYFLLFCVDFTICLSMDVSLSILKTR